MSEQAFWFIILAVVVAGFVWMIFEEVSRNSATKRERREREERNRWERWQAERDAERDDNAG